MIHKLELVSGFLHLESAIIEKGGYRTDEEKLEDMTLEELWQLFPIFGRTSSGMG